MWGIVPAAGRGSRIQPLAFSKELLPVGSRIDAGVERPCAVSEYLLERMVIAGAEKICFVVGPGKADIMEYFGGQYAGASVAYVVQPKPSGLCDAVFRAAPFIAINETVVVGLPDTIWFPKTGLSELPDDGLSFLLFPVDRPEFFDAVVLRSNGTVKEIQVKQREAQSRWIWGAFKMPARIFADLRALWLERECRDEYFGTLVNAYLAAGGRAVGVKGGISYVDVGTLHGYRAAMGMLDGSVRTPGSPADAAASVVPDQRAGSPAGAETATIDAVSIR
ncbi:MAG: nucleotidyltransferase family protein [Xanthobacteraceae bacterium]|nr:nucleotidyltransferase family protein [Xanthobacteraceae bacterium]